VRAATALLLLAPQVPLLFMGEEDGSTQPFQFFTDYRGELADAVRDGRRREFAAFRRLQTPRIATRFPIRTTSGRSCGRRRRTRTRTRIRMPIRGGGCTAAR
jgi:1,4-alpha-glucan branching enzyme